MLPVSGESAGTLRKFAPGAKRATMLLNPGTADGLDFTPAIERLLNGSAEETNRILADRGLLGR
jgi:hypothetical protein